MFDKRLERIEKLLQPKKVNRSFNCCGKENDSMLSNKDERDLDSVQKAVLDIREELRKIQEHADPIDFLQSAPQQSQIKPESSQASINQAFIDSAAMAESKDNTSFFGNGKTGALGNNNSVLSSKRFLHRVVLGKGNNEFNPAVSERLGEDDNELIKRMWGVNDLSLTEREKLLASLYNKGGLDVGGLASERKDVRLEDLLEISKKSVSSSYRGQSKGQGKRDSDKMSILKILGELPNIGPFAPSPNEEKKKNSTLEISFNQAEIQVVDGMHRRQDDEEFKELLEGKISTQDMKKQSDRQYGLKNESDAQRSLEGTEELKKNEYFHDLSVISNVFPPGDAGDISMGSMGNLNLN